MNVKKKQFKTRLPPNWKA